MIDIQLRSEPLDAQTCLDAVASDKAGGHVLFVGTVRDHTQGKKVNKLHFESYEPMAVKEMRKIAERAMNKWPLLGISVHHRVGELDIGEIPVIIAVSSAHRKEAFAACEFVIDELKKTVPIWKKEYFDDGEVWVAAHP